MNSLSHKVPNLHIFPPRTTFFFFAHADFCSIFPQCGAWSQANTYAYIDVLIWSDIDRIVKVSTNLVN